METFTVRTKSRTQLLDITREVVSAISSAISKRGLDRGACLVHVPHTTAGVTINENADPSVRADLESALDRLVPWNGPYTHGEGNSAAHIKSTLVGSSVTVPVEGGRPVFGTWQGVYFCE
ncbi:MAG: secondary thiamine-phosphate synthase enzyme YjbQ, partial [Planctomycetota bacterium]